MAKIEIKLPAMGEGIIEATIIKWLASEGSMVEEDQPLVEIATDKVDTEIPSPVKGTLAKVLKDEGEVISVGGILALIETDSKEQTASGDESREKTGSGSKAEASESMRQVQEIPGHTQSGKFLTPLVRKIAKEEHISIQELDNIAGSGEGGRITRNDLLNYLKNKSSVNKDRETFTEKEKAETITETENLSGIKAIHPGPEEKISSNEAGDRIIEMDRMRKLIASHMVSSKHTAPHVTSFIDADVTDLVMWREANKGHFRERENQNLTFTPMFIEASAKALRDFPMVNISVDGSRIIIKKNINIGIAVALSEGNLIVPVIKNADEKSLAGLAKAVNDLAGRARNGTLQPDDISGGTFTITNFGTFKNRSGTPIINQPEVAILGAGAIIKKPVVLETDRGDVIAIRSIMTLSLSYDHRVVDGALGGKFLSRIAEYLENFDIKRKI